MEPAREARGLGRFAGQQRVTEATDAVTDWAFDALGVPELLLNNAEPNLASHRLKARCGAEIVAVREQAFVGGAFPSVRWRLTAEAWRRYREG